MNPFHQLGMTAILCILVFASAYAQGRKENIEQTIVSGKVFALPDEKTSVFIGAKTSDRYSHIYTLDHATQKISMRLDAGRNISKMLTNYSKSKFYVLMDQLGDENFEIFEYEIASNSLRKIFGNTGFNASVQGFSVDDKTVYIRSNHQNKSIYSLYSVSLETLQATIMTDGKESFDGAIVSPSEKYVFLVKAMNNHETRLYKLDRATRIARMVLSEKGTIFWPTFFGHNEKYLYAKTDWDNDRLFCGRVLVNAPSIVEPVRMSESKDVECEYDRFANVTFLTESYEGRTDLKIYDDILERELTVQVAEKATVSAATAVGKSKKVIFNVSKANEAGDFYLANLKDRSKPTRISNFSSSTSANMAETRSFDFPVQSFDKRRIHSIYFAMESWINSKTKHPVIVWAHGGPDEHMQHAFYEFIQHWTTNGYIVLAPNSRGSSGYGKAFEKLNDRDWGGGHVNDLIYAKRAFAKLPFVDANRIFIAGPNYGGFSALSVIALHPNEFRAAATINPIVNLQSYVSGSASNPTMNEELNSEIGDSKLQAAFIKDRSPVNMANKIKTPLLIFYSENDRHVAKSDVESFVASVRGSGVIAKFELLTNEGHQIQRAESKSAINSAMLSFFESFK